MVQMEIMCERVAVERFVNKLGLWGNVDLYWQKDKDLQNVMGKRSACVFQSLT